MLCNFVFHQVEAEKLQLDSAPFGKRFYQLSFLIDTNLIVWKAQVMEYFHPILNTKTWQIWQEEFSAPQS